MDYFPVDTRSDTSSHSIEESFNELTPRSPRCGGDRLTKDEYKLGLHVMALFVVLTTSTLACAFPLIAKRFPQLRIPPNFMFFARHFGTGVLIATAFIHLLPTAFNSLGDPCLPKFWTEQYQPMAGAIAMLAVFLVAVVEMLFTRGLCKGHCSSDDRREATLEVGPDEGSGSSKSEKANTDEVQRYGELASEQAHKKALLQCALLELGILFHSVFIGMALSVTVGPGFIVLLVAIIFHQTFEGMALGSRIAVLKWQQNSVQPWLMVLAYGLTTPIGQAIGLGLHTAYDPDSQTGLLLVGIMNAISSGLLLFAGLVELLGEDFLSEKSWQELTGRRRVVACACVFAGATGMSLIGAFA